MVNLRVFDQITIYEFFRRFNIASERQLSFAYCDTRDRGSGRFASFSWKLRLCYLAV